MTNVDIRGTTRAADTIFWIGVAVAVAALAPVVLFAGPWLGLVYGPLILILTVTAVTVHLITRNMTHIGRGELLLYVMVRLGFGTGLSCLAVAATLESLGLSSW